MRRLGWCVSWILFAGGGGIACADRADDHDALVASQPDASAAGDVSAASPDAAGVVDAGEGGATAVPDTKPREVACAKSPCALQLSRIEGRKSASGGFCVLLDDGTVACWGDNWDGGLGRNTTELSSPIVQRVTGLTHVKSLEKTCAIDEAGVAWCWGGGPFLQSTTSAATTQRTPVELPIPAPVKRLSFAYDDEAAVGCAEVDTGFYCWGTNLYGHLGGQVPGASTSQVLGLQEFALPPGAPITKLKVSHAAFVLREDGSVLSWGSRITIGRASSFSPDPEPYPMDLAPISALDSIEDNACAVSNGVGYCWGAPMSHLFNLAMSRALPRAIEMPEPIVDVSTSMVAPETGGERVCAVGVSGAVYCLGYNGEGQAGDPSFEDAVHPVAVQGLPAPAVTVKITTNTSCALLTTGRVFCWGANSSGGLGQGEPVDSSATPLEVKLP